MNKLRTIIADDERPAREFLKNLLREFDFVELVGEAENGSEAIEIIKNLKPDLALLDLQMPEITGIEVVKLIRKSQMPIIAFVTAFDEYAIQAFEVGATDYLLKPIEKSRLAETLARASERLEHKDFREVETEKIKKTIESYDEIVRQPFLERIPVKRNEEILLVPVREIASIIADGELLYITNLQNKRFIINYRLKDLEMRLSPEKFIRLSRGALVNLEMISSVAPMPGGTYEIKLKNGQEIISSRLQSRILREKIFKL